MKLRKEALILEIKGVQWTFKVMPDRSYARRNGGDSEAITHLNTKEVHFKDGSFRLNVIYHELGHVLIDTAGTSSSNLDLEQFEELLCELFAEHIPDIIKWAQMIDEHFRNTEDDT